MDKAVRHVAAYLTLAVPIARPAERIQEVLNGLPGRRFDSVQGICVVNDDGTFVGVVPLVEALAASGDVTIGALVPAASPVLGPEADREDAASLAIREDLSVVPVVDEGGRFLGIVPARAIMGVLREEHLEDLHHLAGILHHSEEARLALQAPPLQRARYRLPWLVIGLLGSMLAATLVARFESILEAQIAIAFFIPAIVYLADAVGTQSEAVAVRGLSLTDAGVGHLLKNEVIVGVLMGVVLAVAAGLYALVVFGAVNLAATVAIALLCACAVATSVGLYLPWVFSRAGWDPALASGPIATIIQDVLSLLIYFSVATALL